MSSRNINGNDDETRVKKRGAVQVLATPSEGAVFRSISMSFAAPTPKIQEDSSRNKSFKKAHFNPIPLGAAASNPSDESWVWKIETSLRPLPLFHPLERTALTIEDVSLDTVTSRISEFMKQKSITCSYQTDNVECLTDGLLKFVVQLWKGAAKNKNHTVLEIQRKQGCCLDMQAMRRDLVQAILTGSVDRQKSNPPRSSCEFLESFLKKAGNMVPPTPKLGKCLPTAVSMCRRLLESNHLDENRLGLESLIFLTDSSKTFATDADKVSSEILRDTSFQDLLLKYFVDTERIPSNILETDTGVMGYGQGEFFGCLHIMALKVLSNALASAARKQPLPPSTCIDLSSLFWQRVLEALYYNLQSAPHRPIEASLSIRCLHLLQIVEPSTANLAPSQGSLHQHLLNAYKFGRNHSRSLERETEQLMGRLGFVH